MKACEELGFVEVVRFRLMWSEVEGVVGLELDLVDDDLVRIYTSTAGARELADALLAGVGKVEDRRVS